MASLQELGRRKYVSVAGLAEVLKEIKENGLPEHISRSSIKRARDSEFDDYHTPYGKVLRSTSIGTDSDGDPCVFWMADSRAVLYFMISECPKLGQFFSEKLAQHPCNIENPWNIIVYNDEISPGDQFLHHNRRKTQAFYYSFLEFGAIALSSEFLWFTLSASRSDDVGEIEGHSFGIFAKDQMLSFESWSTVGFQCGAIMIWARVGLLVCDESALKYTLDVKGASGNLPCFKCANVLSKTAFAKCIPGRGMTSITDTNFEAFDLHTNESIKANAQHLDTTFRSLRRGQKGAFEKLEMALGLNYSPSGVLLSRLNFNPITGTCYDPQHVYLVSGIFNAEIGQLLVVLKKTMKIKPAGISTFFHSFEWPAIAKTGKLIFDDRSDKSITDSAKSTAKSNPTFSCSASDALGAFALLQEFLMLQVIATATAQNNKAAVAACASFFALCQVIALTTMVPRGGVSAELLMAKIVAHLKAHKTAYGDSHWTPKFHYSLHLPEQLLRWDVLIFCFTHERKHKELKRYLQGRMNTTGTFDKNVLQDVLHIQKLALREDGPYPRGTQLLHPRKPDAETLAFLSREFPTGTDFLTSIDAKCGNFVSCHINDVVYITWGSGMAIGRVEILCSVGDECMGFVCIWHRMPQNNMYNTKGDYYFVLLSDFVDTCVFKVSGDLAYVVPPRGAVHAELVGEA